jgi:hypothetical protein
VLLTPLTERTEMKLNFEKNKLLGLLLLADLAFIFLHILHVYTSLLPSTYYSLARDRGYGEFYQYLKEFWIFILFLILGVKHRKLLFVTYATLFLYLLIDDSFEFHENFGAFIADMFQFQPQLGLRAIDFGEMAVTGFFGGLFAISITIFHYYSDNPTRAISKKIILMVILLFLFGVVLDMVEIVVDHNLVASFLVILEEGGEMLVMSFITWFVFQLRL